MDLLSQLSTALAERAQAVQPALVAIRLSPDRHISGTLWGADIVVASEQSLPERNEFELVLPGGALASAALVGRDPSTNVALLRLPQPLAFQGFADAEPRAGALALAFGADGSGGASVRMGLVNLAGPEWTSSAGGRIDRRIVLDMRLAAAEEGGPVLDAAGRRLGISTFGPRRKVLVIPSQTVERTVAALLKDGRVARGWIGVALQPVAVPEALASLAGHPGGWMVMSIAPDGPAAKAGVLPGDIVVALDGAPARRFAARFGPESIGRKTELRLIRGGAVLNLQALIEERRSE